MSGVYWWNPLVWHAARRAAEMREVIADGYCVAILGAREAYVGLLLETAKRLVARACCTVRRRHGPHGRSSGGGWNFCTRCASRHLGRASDIAWAMLAIGSVLLLVAGLVHGVEPAPPASEKDAAGNSTESNAAKSGGAAIRGDSAANDSPPHDIAPAELLYLAWHNGRGASTGDTAPPAYWDRDGKLLGEQRSAEIFEQTERFVRNWWLDDEWPPLVLVFKVDPRLTLSPLMPTVVTGDGTVGSLSVRRPRIPAGLLATLLPTG